MFIFIIFILQTYSQNSDLIKNNCTDEVFINYNLFLEDVANINLFNACVKEDAIIQNLFKPIHQKFGLNFLDEASVDEASNICEAMDKKHLPSSLHYAFLISEAFKKKKLEFNYFNVFNHYGIFFKSGITNKESYISILSHYLEEGIACSKNNFISNVFNKYKVASIDGKDMAYVDNFTELNSKDVKTLLLNEFKKIEEPQKLETATLMIDLDNLEDNTNISLYVQGSEIIDKHLRSLANAFLSVSNVSLCFEKTEALLDFEVTETGIESDNVCLETYLSKNFFPALENVYNVRVVALIKV